jgi:hypothetical protein
VTERLREVAERLTRGGVHLLGEQADVVREPEESMKQRLGLVELARVREAVEKPERAEEEGALAAREPIRREIPEQETIAFQRATSSGSARSPRMRYMICRSSGRPAPVRSSQNLKSSASSRNPSTNREVSVSVASRIHV